MEGVVEVQEDPQLDLEEEVLAEEVEEEEVVEVELVGPEMTWVHFPLLQAPKVKVAEVAALVLKVRKFLIHLWKLHPELKVLTVRYR